MCKCITCLLKFLLAIVAILMMIVGIVLTVVGAFFLWGMSVIMKNIAPVMNDLNQLLKNIGVNVDAKVILDVFVKNSNIIGAVTFTIGVVLLIISVLLLVAMCCCSSKTLYIVLAVLLSAIAIGLIVALAFYANKPEERLWTPLESVLKENVVNKYQGLEETNPESVVMNVLHVRLQCCGLRGFGDFNSATDFKRSGKLSAGTEFKDILFPISCCNYQPNFTISKVDLDTCLNSKKSDRQGKGCWTIIKDTYGSYVNYVYISVGVIIGVLVAVVIVLIFFICCMDKFE